MEMAGSLWVELFGICFGEKDGSISAVEVGDGARYRKYFLMLYRYFGSY